MPQSGFPSIPHPLPTWLFASLLAVLVWAPLPFGSNREWAGAGLAVATSALCAASLQYLIFRPGHWQTAGVRAGSVALLLLVLVQCWTALQLLPLPGELVAMLSPQAFAWHIREGGLPLSLDVSATRYRLLIGIAVTQVFFLTLLLVTTRQRVNLLLGALVFSGTLQASYGVLMTLSGVELGFFVEKYAGRGVATGTFVNRNHLAGYLVLCLAAGTGLLLAQLSPYRRQSWRDRLRGWLELAMSNKFRLRIFLALMVVALVLTRSRMGNVAFFSALVFAATLTLVAGRRFSWGVALLLVSLLVVDLWILGTWFGLDKVVERLETLESRPIAEDARYWLDAYTLVMLRDFWATGIGAGAFPSVFPNYQGPALKGYYEYAHNDYLQIAAELGVAVLLMLASVVLMAARQAFGALKSGSRLVRGIGFTVLMAIGWAILHSSTDFNLYIPAVAVTFSAILALAFTTKSELLLTRA